ncbi:WD40-repeat-containing domain protein [Cytidiella melzeri]|nr:WD40-repeat-containing domain protein [Cytidiella melzeri]
MPDGFFANPKTRKRKRSTSGEGPSTSKKPARSQGKQQFAANGKKPASRARDEELSDETHDEDDGGGVDEMDLRAPDVDPEAYESAEEDEDETPAEKRLRLAKLYLDGVKQGLGLADGEFDAAEIDRELISSRLKLDVLEHSGKIHLFVADSYDLSNTPTLRTRGHKFSATAAVSSEDARWLYTSSKDGSIVKWDLRTGRKSHTFFKVRPTMQDKGKGKAKAGSSEELKGHTDEIWALALSPDGSLLASGGKDRRIGVWNVEKNEWVKGFGGHRDSISALAFRKAQPTSTTPIQLYSGSFDRSLKVFDLSVMGYIETLFGHQAPVLHIDTLLRETAVSVGGRDKSVRYWKVPEESQLVFRGGGRSGWEDVLEGQDLEDDMDVDADGNVKEKQRKKKSSGKVVEKFVEGSLECVAMIDESTFVSGGDSGSICLWTTQKKKPVFTQALAHGMDESHTETEDVEIVRKPRWITALACLRYSDLFVSGSWDGEIRLWKVDSKLKSFSLVGSIPALGVVNSLQILQCSRSTVSQFTWAAEGQADGAVGKTVNGHDVENHARSKSSSPASAILVAGVGQEMRFGRWVQKKGQGVLNGALVVALHPRTPGSTLESS